MSQTQVFNYSLKFNADTGAALQNINALQKTLLEIQKVPLKTTVDSALFKEAANAARELSIHLSKATDINTGKLNVNALSASLKASGTDLTRLTTQLMNVGAVGNQAFAQLSAAIANSTVPIKTMNKTLASLGQSLANTVKWQLSSSMVHGLMSGLSSALGYAKDLNKSLNDIRIVTGYSADQMAKFAEQANRAAKNLSTTTTAYTNAALIYYQQGDSPEEVQKKAEITLKAANAAFGTSAKEMSEYLTAVWNSYQVGADELERYVDIMAALGAKTATSLEEIATSMQKVAATANTVGVSMEQVSSIVATVSSVTRESAESIGTAYKTIFARIGDLKINGIDEDGIGLGQVSSQLKQVGISILDTQGNLRDMGAIIEELGTKWQNMSTVQQTAIAQAVAGKRQYTQLIALMSNLDMYQENLSIAKNSEGEADRQAKIYEESWAAATNRTRASLEKLWGALIDDKAFISATDAIGDLVTQIANLAKGLGGFKGILLTVSGALMQAFGPQIASKLDAFGAKIKSLASGNSLFNPNQSKQYVANLQGWKQELAGMVDSAGATEAQKMSIQFDLQAIELKEKLAQSASRMSSAQIQAAEQVIGALQQEKALYLSIYEAQEKARTEANQVKQNALTQNYQQVMAGNPQAYANMTITQGQQLAGQIQYQNLLNAQPTQMAAVTNLATTQNAATQVSPTLQALGNTLQTNPSTAGISSLLDSYEELESRITQVTSAQQQFQSSFSSENFGKIVVADNLDQAKQDLENLAKAAGYTDTELEALRQAFAGIKTPEELKNSTAFQNLETKLNETVISTDDLKKALEILKPVILELFGGDQAKMDEWIAKIRQGSQGTRDLGDSADEARKRFQAMYDQVSKKASTVSSAITSVASALTSVVSMCNAAKSAWEVWNDEDATTWEKIAAGISLTTTVLFAYSGITAVVQNLNKLTLIQTLANTIATKLFGATAASAGATAAAAWMAALGPLALIVGAVGLVIAGFVALINAIKNRETAEKKLAKTTEEATAATTKYNTKGKEIVSVMSQMQTVIMDTTKTFAEQRDEIAKLGREYGIIVTHLTTLSELEANMKASMSGQVDEMTSDLDTQRGALANTGAAYIADDNIGLTGNNQVYHGMRQKGQDRVVITDNDRIRNLQGQTLTENDLPYYISHTVTLDSNTPAKYTPAESTIPFFDSPNAYTDQIDDWSNPYALIARGFIAAGPYATLFPDAQNLPGYMAAAALAHADFDPEEIYEYLPNYFESADEAATFINGLPEEDFVDSGGYPYINYFMDFEDGESGQGISVLDWNTAVRERMLAPSLPEDQALLRNLLPMLNLDEWSEDIVGLQPKYTNDGIVFDFVDADDQVVFSKNIQDGTLWASETAGRAGRAWILDMLGASWNGHNASYGASFSSGTLTLAYSDDIGGPKWFSPDVVDVLNGDTSTDNLPFDFDSDYYFGTNPGLVDPLSPEEMEEFINGNVTFDTPEQAIRFLEQVRGVHVIPIAKTGWARGELNILGEDEGTIIDLPLTDVLTGGTLLSGSTGLPQLYGLAYDETIPGSEIVYEPVGFTGSNGSIARDMDAEGMEAIFASMGITPIKDSHGNVVDLAFDPSVFLNSDGRLRWDKIAELYELTQPGESLYNYAIAEGDNFVKKAISMTYGLKDDDGTYVYKNNLIPALGAHYELNRTQQNLGVLDRIIASKDFKPLTDTSTQTVEDILGMNLGEDRTVRNLTRREASIALEYLSEFDTYKENANKLLGLVDLANRAGERHVSLGYSSSVAMSQDTAYTQLMEILTNPTAAAQALGLPEEIAVDLDVLLRLSPSDIEWVGDNNDQIHIDSDAYDLAAVRAAQDKAITRGQTLSANKEILTGERITYDNYVALTKSGLYTDTEIANGTMKAELSDSQEVRTERYNDEVDQATLDLITGRDRMRIIYATTDYLRDKRAARDAAIAEVRYKPEGASETLTGAPAFAQAEEDMATLQGEVATIEDAIAILNDSSYTDEDARLKAIAALGLPEEIAEAIYTTDSDGKYQFIDGVDARSAAASLTSGISTRKARLEQIRVSLGDAYQLSIDVDAAEAEQLDLLETTQADAAARQEILQRRASRRATVFSNAVGKAGQMSASDLEMLSYYLKDENVTPKQATAQVMAAYNQGGETWDTFVYNNAMAHFTELERLYANDPEKLAEVIQQKEAMENTYWTNRNNRAKASYEYTQSLAQAELKKQQERVEILKTLLTAEKELSNAQKKNLEQLLDLEDETSSYRTLWSEYTSGMTISGSDSQRALTLLEKQTKGVQLYVAALGEQALAEQEILDAKTPARNSNYIKYLTKSTGSEEKLTEAFSAQDDGASLETLMGTWKLNDAEKAIMREIYAEANGAALTADQIWAAYTKKLAELEDAGEDIWATFKDSAVEALTSVINMEQMQAQKTVEIWTNAYKAIATARTGFLEGKTLLESLYGDETQLAAMVQLLTGGSNSSRTFAATLNILNSKNASNINGLSPVFDLSTWTTSQGAAYIPFGTNLDIAQDDWETAIVAYAQTHAKALLDVMDADAVTKAYGYTVTEENGVRHYFKDGIEVTNSELATNWVNKTIGTTTEERTAAYNASKSGTWAHLYAMRGQANAARQQGVNDYFTDMQTIDKIIRGETGTTAADILAEATALGVSVSDYIHMTPEARTRTAMSARTSRAQTVHSYTPEEVARQMTLLQDSSASEETPIDPFIRGYFNYLNEHIAEGITQDTYSFEQYMGEHHANITLMTPDELAAYNREKAIADKKQEYENRLKPIQNAQTSLSTLNKLDLNAADAEDTWDALYASINNVLGPNTLKGFDAYTSGFERQIAVQKAQINMNKKYAAEQKAIYEAAQTDGTDPALLEQYRQNWLNAESQVSSSISALEQQYAALATGALTKQKEEWEKTSASINAASQSLSGFLTNIESWGNASAEAIATLQEHLNKLGITYKAYTGNAETDALNLLTMNLALNKEEAQLLTQKQNSYGRILAENHDTAYARQMNEMNFLDKLDDDDFATFLSDNNYSNAIGLGFTSTDVGYILDARKRALELNHSLSGQALWDEIKRILAEDKAEIDVDLVINTAQRKDLWNTMLTSVISAEEAAAKKVIETWENAFQAILQARENLSAGKSILESMFGSPEQMGAIMAQLLDLGYTWTQVLAYIKNPNADQSVLTTDVEDTKTIAWGKHGLAAQMFVYNSNGSLANDQGYFDRDGNLVPEAERGTIARGRVATYLQEVATDEDIFTSIFGEAYNPKTGLTDAQKTTLADTYGITLDDDGKINRDGLDYNALALRILGVKDVTELGKMVNPTLGNILAYEASVGEKKRASELRADWNELEEDNDARTWRSSYNNTQYTTAQLSPIADALANAADLMSTDKDLSGLTKKEAKLLMDYFNVNSIEELEALGFDVISTEAINASSGLQVLNDAAVAAADTMFSLAGYTKNDNGKWYRTMSEDDWKNSLTKEQKAKYLDAEGNLTEAGQAAYDKDKYLYLDETTQGQYDALVTAAEEEPKYDADNKLASQVTISTNQLNAVHGMMDLKSGTQEWSAGIVELESAFAGNEYALGIIKQLKDGTIEWEEANKLLTSGALLSTDAINQMSAAQWNSYKATLAQNGVMVEGYDTLEEYFAAMEKGRKVYEKATTWQKNMNDEMAETSKTWKNSEERIKGVKDAIKDIDFEKDFGLDLGDNADKVDAAFDALIEVPKEHIDETNKALEQASEQAGNYEFTWLDMVAIKEKMDSDNLSYAQAVDAHLAEIGVLDQNVANTLKNFGGENYTATYGLLATILGSVDPAQYNTVAQALMDWAAGMGVELSLPLLDNEGTTATTNNNKKGGGGGGGKKKPTERKKYSDIERYHEIEGTVKAIENEMSKIEKMRERAFGPDKLKILDAELRLLQKQKEAQEATIAEATKWLKSDQALLNSLVDGVEYLEDGRIANWSELQHQWVDEYNTAVAAADAISNEEKKKEAIEAAQKEYDRKVEAVENYEEAIEKAVEAGIELEDIINQMSAKLLEKIQYNVEYKMELNESDLEIMEYYLDTFEDDVFKSAESMDNMMEQITTHLDDLKTLKEGYNELIKEYNNGAGLMTDADFQAGLKEFQSQIVDTLSELHDLKKEMKEFYEDILDNASEELENHTEKLDAIVETMESYISIQELMGKGVNYEWVTGIYQTQYEANRALLTANKQYLDTLIQARDEATDPDLIEAYNDAIIEANESLLESTEAVLKTLQKIYENTIASIFDTLDKSLAGTADSVEELSEDYAYYQEVQERYVSTAKELHEVSKLNRDIEKLINETASQTNKNLLKQLQERIKAQSKMNELTQYDLDMNQKQYELLLAKIALEEAQNAKDTVRLVRDANGNYAYQYTADQGKIDEAEQKYEDALYAIHQLSAERIKEMEQEMIDARKTFLDSAKEIAEAEYDSEDERYEDLLKLFNQYKERMTYSYAEYEEATDHLGINAQSFAELFGVSVDEIYGGSSLMNEALGALFALGADATFEDAWTAIQAVMQAAKDREDAVKDATDEAGTSLDGMSGNANQASGAIGGLIGEITDLNTRLGEEFIEVNKVADAWLRLHEVLSSASLDYGQIAENMQKLQEAIGTDGLGLILGDIIINDDAMAGVQDTEDQLNPQMPDGSKQYATGGLVDYTGPAWVDGTPDKPELMLNATDTPRFLEAIKIARQINFRRGFGDSSIGQYANIISDTLEASMAVMYDVMANSYHATDSAFRILSAIKSEPIDQNVTIDAHFPSVTNHTEIEDALNNLINQASHFTNRNF